MAVPPFASFLLPTLQFAADGKDHTIGETMEKLKDVLGLDAEDLKTLLPSGKQTIVYNRVVWAGTYLKNAGMIERPKRGSFRITDRGKEFLARKPDRITIADLTAYPEFQQFHTSTIAPGQIIGKPPETTSETPEEEMERLHLLINSRLSDELLSTIMNCTPRFFERLVIDLLLAMGYGGSAEEAAEVIGGSGDEGIDGIIKEDRLGLDTIYVQAKRWKEQIGRPEIQKFAGALLGKKARKGIFLTTASFSKDAVEYARGVDNKIVLIDGRTLSDLMIQFDVGLSTESTYRVKKIDSDYFDDESNPGT